MNSKYNVLKFISKKFEKVEDLVSIEEPLEISLKFKKDKIINKLELVSREEFEVLKKLVQKQDATIKKLEKIKKIKKVKKP